MAYDKAIYDYDTDGSHQYHLLDVEYSVRGLHSRGNTLFVACSGYLNDQLISINKTTSTISDTIDRHDQTIPVSATLILPQANRILGIHSDDLVSVSYSGGRFTAEYTRIHEL